jgi:hypothetical protein
MMEQLQYQQIQEDLAFDKELNILRNDFYYQYEESFAMMLVDFMYKPLDTLSGDAYSARRVGKDKSFYMVVDGMGKGVSASLTTMIFTSYVNHTVDMMVQKNHFCIVTLIEKAIAFIKPILLEEETLCVDFICLDMSLSKMYYAKFSMPPFLLQKNTTGEVVRIPSNNTPISKWHGGVNVGSYAIEDIQKFLFYSDGIVENATQDGRCYAEYIDGDFQTSFTREEFKEKMNAKLTDQEDDFSLVFLNTLYPQTMQLLTTQTYETRLDMINEAVLLYGELWEQWSSDTRLGIKATMVFNELILNAYEHGNLEVDSQTKHAMLEDDTFFDVMKEKEQKCDKKIFVNVYKIVHFDSEYILTTIEDEGEGFDTQLLTTIFRKSKNFNGRGVFLSRKNSMGIYYNEKGNKVLFLNKL